jgi:hypothetical protein
MRKQAIIALLALASCLALPGRIWAQDFGLFGRVLSQAEASAVKGGETYASVSLGRGMATVTSIPRDSYGMDYSRASSFSVGVHNRVDYKTVNEKAYSYDTARFPKGTASMDVSKISDEYRQDRYGSSKGEWITTDAKRLVTAYPNRADETPVKSKPYMKEDSGYFWHANNAKPFEESKSYGCLISPQKDLDRVISVIKNDRGPKRIEVH